MYCNKKKKKVIRELNVNFKFKTLFGIDFRIVYEGSKISLSYGLLDFPKCKQTILSCNSWIIVVRIVFIENCILNLRSEY